MKGVLEARGVRVRRGGAETLRAVSAAVQPGRLVGVIGPNGAGKSTLLKVLAGVLAPAAGNVTWRGEPGDGRALAELGVRARARAIGYLPQRPRVDWPLSVREVVALGRLPHRPWWQTGPAAADRAAVDDAIARCRLGALAERPVDTLSGGEFARAMLARLLAGGHEVLICDEPVADLDPPHRVDVMRILRQEAARGAGVVAALHDLGLAHGWCDEVWLMAAGRLVASGPAEAVMTAPQLSAAFGAPCRLVKTQGLLAVDFAGTAADTDAPAG